MTMKKITAGRDMLGEFAPKFAQLNDDVLFGEVWSRESELSARDRSLITVTALMAQGLTDTSFGHHLAMAKEWDHPQRNCGDPDTRRILCGLAEGMGSIPHGKGHLGRRGKRRRKAASSKQYDISHRSAQ